MSQKTRVFIGGLPPRVNETAVQKFFKGFGDIRQVKLKKKYGFVEFADPRDAEDAVEEMNNQPLCGGRINVEHAKGNPRSRNFRGNYGSRHGTICRTNYRVVVENVSSRTGWQDLKELFSPVVEVAYAEVHQDLAGEGILEFHSRQDLEKAVDNFDGAELNGRKMKLIEAYDSRNRSILSRSPKKRSYSRSPLRGYKYPSRSRSSLSVSPKRSAVRGYNSSSRSYSKSRPRCYKSSIVGRSTLSRSPKRRRYIRSPARSYKSRSNSPLSISPKRSSYGGGYKYHCMSRSSMSRSPNRRDYIRSPAGSYESSSRSYSRTTPQAYKSSVRKYIRTPPQAYKYSSRSSSSLSKSPKRKSYRSSPAFCYRGARNESRSPY